MNALRVFHQNIRGLKYYEIDELLNALSPDFPRFMLNGTPYKFFRKEHCYFDHYNLGAVYCRKFLSKGGVCIFVHNSLSYLNINLDKFCIDQTIEVCALKLFTAGCNICIVAVYRAPSGNFSQFLNSLDRALNTIYSSSVEFIVCGDINVNYLKDSSKKKQLNTLLLSFNLFSIIEFLTRSQNNSVS
jgi:hypothetical protein